MKESAGPFVESTGARVQIVLIDTSHSGNIGAVARAVKNMGLSRLVLVNPKEFPSDEATRRASGADDVLKRARVVETLDAAIGSSSLVVGASARTRHLVWPMINPRDCAARVLDCIGTGKDNDQAATVSILFGRESSGLSNEELQRCHVHVNIPANPDYASLNLAMAVQVICYELRMAALSRDQKHAAGGQLAPINGPGDLGWDVDLASVDEVEGLLSHLEQTLIKIGFHDPANPRMLMSRLRRFVHRAHPDKMEVNILRGILKAVQQSIKLPPKR